MAQTVIKAENISKYYQLGVVNAGSLKLELQSRFDQLFRRGAIEIEDSSTHIWALKDINFEVSEGEVVGFVGKNGAGKSTLLKIISRVTMPTTGSVKGKGRIASLLEVGTGFQPELTGRENIFLNGHILGMTTAEIRRCFDEIIAFSGIERFIDTPVKRYSSGMYVRLAFAVAAHLNPEILIIDEALAVGDDEFQKKCVAKIKEIATSHGKTVVIVSHNMAAVKELCNRAIYLEHGRIIGTGSADDIVSMYLRKEKFELLVQEFPDPSHAPGNGQLRIKKVELAPVFSNSHGVLDATTALHFSVEIWLQEQFLEGFVTGIHIFNMEGQCVCDLSSSIQHLSTGPVRVDCVIPANFLKPDCYYISIDFIRGTAEKVFSFDVCLTFYVQDTIVKTPWNTHWNGQVRPSFPVTVKSQVKDQYYVTV